MQTATLFGGLIAHAPSPADNLLRPVDGRRHEPVSERTDYGLRGKERASGREFEECGNRARGIGGVLQEQVADEGQDRARRDPKRGTRRSATGPLTRAAHGGTVPGGPSQRGPQEQAHHQEERDGRERSPTHCYPIQCTGRRDGFPCRLCNTVAPRDSNLSSPARTIGNPRNPDNYRLDRFYPNLRCGVSSSFH